MDVTIAMLLAQLRLFSIDKTLKAILAELRKGDRSPLATTPETDAEAGAAKRADHRMQCRIARRNHVRRLHKVRQWNPALAARRHADGLMQADQTTGRNEDRFSGFVEPLNADGTCMLTDCGRDANDPEPRRRD